MINLQFEAWERKAACAGKPSSMFFAPDTEGKRTIPREYYNEALQICWEKCPVREECLNAAIKRHERIGVWGGMTYRERERIRKQRKLAAMLK